MEILKERPKARNMRGFFFALAFGAAVALPRPSASHAPQLETSAWTWGTPGSQLVFSSEGGGQWDIFAWDPFGSESPTPLTQTSLDESRPTLSRDRTRVIYVDSAGALWVLDLESQQRAAVLTRGEADYFLDPAIAPGGQYVMLAMRADRATDDTDLVIRLLPVGSMKDAPPEEDPETGPERHTKLTFELGPAWVALPDAAASSWTIPMLSSQFTPCWAPDGTRFAFTHLHSRWTGHVVAELWEARVDHSFCRQLTMMNALCEDPAWSPAGDRIAFASDAVGLRFDIYCLDLVDRRIQRITQDPSADLSPVFSPDGRAIAFVSTRSGRPEIWVHDLESRAEFPLRPFGDEVRPCKDPDWQ